MDERSFEQSPRQMASESESHEFVEFGVTRETKLTDLNSDCLYSIFKLLSPYDAIEMCAISKEFVEPVNWIVKGLKQKCDFTVCSHRQRDDTRIVFPTVISVPYYLIKFIGPSLSKLSINYPAYRSVSVVEDPVLQYCTHLRELGLYNFSTAPFENIQGPISTLEMLYLDNCTIGPVFSQFSYWFPKLRTLIVTDCSVIDESCIRNMATTMPELEHLQLGVSLLEMGLPKPWKSLRKELTTEYNIDGIIKQNGHVQHFRLTSGTNSRRLRIISKSMERLENLELHLSRLHYRTAAYSVNFKWVNKLILKISGRQQYHCPLVFDVLQELDITIDDFFEPWLFFARSNQLRKLKLTVNRLLNGLNELLRISSIWPSLIEVSMPRLSLPVAEEAIFIRSFENLERYNVLKPESRYEFVHSRQFDIIKFNLRDEFAALPETSEYYYSLIRLN